MKYCESNLARRKNVTTICYDIKHEAEFAVTRQIHLEPPRSGITNHDTGSITKYGVVAGQRADRHKKMHHLGLKGH